MDSKRARQIASSPDMVNVTWNGVPIYIENINDDNATVNIYPLNQPDNKQKVTLSSLIEH
ncbi:MAG: H-type small acid-soluble spore protein [Clostridiales bacterium]|nr:H-type small acid-soluble spore protein [Clostridiales bacterium]